MFNFANHYDYAAVLIVAVVVVMVMFVGVALTIWKT